MLCRSLRQRFNQRAPLAVALAALLAVVGIANGARAERKVVVARPGIAAGVTDEMKKSVRDGMYRGLTASKAYAVAEGDIGSDLEEVGVKSLASRSDSLKVARAISAWAVLRYQAKLDVGKVKVRVLLIVTRSDKLTFLDRHATADELEDTVKQMVRQLMQQDAHVGSPPGSQPTRSPSGARGGGSALAAKLFGQLNENALSGFVAELNFGGATPLGDDGEGIGFGVRTGAHVGYQLRIGNFQSITPQALITFARFGNKDVLNQALNATSGSTLELGVLAGARYTLHLGPIGVWSGLYLGLAWLQLRLSSSFESLDSAEAGFALDFEFGAHYMITRRFGVGLFFDVVKGFLGKVQVNQSTVEYDAASFAFGLNARLKL